MIGDGATDMEACPPAVCIKCTNFFCGCTFIVDSWLRTQFAAETNLTRNHEVAGSIPGCGIGGRHDLDAVLLRLWCKPAATAPIRPLAWEPPYAAGAAQEIAKRQKQKQNQKTKTKTNSMHRSRWNPKNTFK